MTKMFRWRIVVGLSAFCCWYGAAESKNLLKNQAYYPVSLDKPDQITDWSRTPADGWRRQSRQIYTGAPVETSYLERDFHTGNQLEQSNIPVATNTWYVLTMLYKSSATQTHPHGHHIWLGIKTGETNDEAVAGYVHLGPVAEWSRGRFYWFSGANTAATFFVRFFGAGSAAIGECEMRTIEDVDFQGQWMLDGDFEHGSVGQPPSDWPSYGGDGLTPLIITNVATPFGTRAMQIDLPTNRLVIVGHPAVLAQARAIMKVRFWARADRDGVILQVNCGRLSPPHWRKQGYLHLSTQWQEFKMASSPLPTRGETGWLEGMNDIELCKLYILKYAGPSATVWFDNMRFESEPSISDKADESKTANAVPVRHNLLANSSFEAGCAGWFPHFNHSWVHLQSAASNSWGYTEIDRSIFKEGGCSLKLFVPADPGPVRFQNWCPDLWSAVFDIGQTSSTTQFAVSFWMKNNLPQPQPQPQKLLLVLRGERLSDGRGNHTSCQLEVLPGNEWQRYHAVLRAPESFKRYLAISLGFMKPNCTAGSYWIDAVQVERGPLSDYVPAGDLEVGAEMSHRYPVYTSGEKPVARVYLCSRLAVATNVALTLTVKDWLNRTVDTSQRSVAIPANQTVVIPDVQMFDKQKGSFVLELTARAGNLPSVTGLPLVYGIVSAPRDITKEDADNCMMGIHGVMNFLPREDCLNLLPGGTLDEHLDMLQRIGVRWSREFEVGAWAWEEPERGKFTWLHDDYVNAAKRHGIKVMPVLGNAIKGNGHPMPAWARDLSKPVPEDVNYPDKRFGACFYPKMEFWTNYVREFIAHYGDRVDAVEIMNESGNFEPIEYVAYTRAAFQTIRAVNPRVRVVAPAYFLLPLNEDDNAWAGQVMKYGVYEWLDVFSSHIYPPGYCYGIGDDFEDSTDFLGTVPVSLKKRLAYLRKAYGTKPVWDTEWAVGGGTQTPWLRQNDSSLINEVDRLSSPRTQAERLVRWLTVRKAEGVERFFYHNTMGTINGLMNADWSPRPAMVAYAEVCRLLDGTRAVRSLNRYKTNWFYLFEKDGHPLLVYWNHESPEGGELELALNPRDVQACDLMGNPLPTDAKAPRVVLPLSTSPVYLSSDRLSLTELWDKVENALCRIEVSDQMAVTLGHSNSQPCVVVAWCNRNSRFEDVSVRLSLPEQWAVSNATACISNIPPDSIYTMRIPLTSYRAEATGGLIKATGQSSDSDRMIEAQREFLAYCAPQRSAEVIIDGQIDLNEYGNTASMRLNAAGQIRSGTNCWTNTADGSAETRIVWDSKAIYIGIQIADDYVVNTAPSNALFNGDSVEIYLDTMTDQDMLSDDFFVHQGKFIAAPPQAPNERNPRVFFRSHGTCGGAIGNVDCANMVAASRRTDHGYTLELKIPVTQIALARGLVWGFDWSLIDYDGASNGERTQFVWCGRIPWAKPHEFGYLVLTP